MSLKFVTRKLKTQTLGDDEGDVNEVKEKDVRSGESSKSDINNKEDNVVSFYTLDDSRQCHVNIVFDIISRIDFIMHKC